MAIETMNLSKKSEEQINNKETMNRLDKNDAFLKDIYTGIQKILEKDEYDLFSLNSKNIYDKKLKDSDHTISKLIELNQKGKQTYKKILQQLTEIKNSNKKIIDILKGKLS